VVQAFTVAPTTANIEELFKRIYLELSGKEICAASSRAVSLLNMAYENAIAYNVTSAGGFVTFSGTIDLHVENDGMFEDFLTLDNKPATMSVNLTTGDNTVFTNGTLTVGSVPTTTVKLRAKDYGVNSFYADNGKFFHSVTEKFSDLTTATSGTRTIQLNGNCLTRAMLFLAGSVVGSVYTPNDSLIGNIRYTLNGVTTLTTFAALKQMLQRGTSINRAGVSGIVFGDTLKEMPVTDAESITISYDVVNPLGLSLRFSVVHDATRPTV
jgi:hypothetical protein